MKHYKNKIFIVLAALFIGLILSACNNNTTQSVTTTQGTTTTTTQDVEKEYVLEGTPTAQPYDIYNADGTTFKTGFDNMYDAIREAGKNATSTNKMQVYDANGLKIFERQSQSQYWCYDSTNFVGSKPRAEALEWGKERHKCYIINGQGTSYVMIGAKYYENSDMSQDIPLELNTGAYNYMFSKGGEMEAGQWSKLGYGYMECNVRLSEATYTKTEATDGAWNVYVFINASGGLNSDLGLIGVVREGKLVFALCRNCSHSSHKARGDGFAVLSWDPVTTMEYDESKGYYCGADDLKFQCWQTIDGWIMNITNLTTNKVYTINEKHTGMFEDSIQYFRFLLAASYVPVVGDIWNARNNASLRNVIFENIYVSRFNPTNTYTEDTFEEFYPGSPSMLYGFSQGGDCASMIFDSHKENGTYLSGLPYNAGDKFVSFSVYYDGGGHYNQDKE